MASLSGNKRVFRWAIKSACMWAILMANPQANAEEANRIRDALSGALGATLCAGIGNIGRVVCGSWY